MRRRSDSAAIASRCSVRVLAAEITGLRVPQWPKPIHGVQWRHIMYDHGTISVLCGNMAYGVKERENVCLFRFVPSRSKLNWENDIAISMLCRTSWYGGETVGTNNHDVTVTLFLPVPSQVVEPFSTRLGSTEWRVGFALPTDCVVFSLRWIMQPSIEG